MSVSNSNPCHVGCVRVGSCPWCLKPINCRGPSPSSNGVQQQAFNERSPLALDLTYCSSLVYHSFIAVGIMAASVKTSTTTTAAFSGSATAAAKRNSIGVLLHSFETGVYGSFQIIQRKVRPTLLVLHCETSPRGRTYWIQPCYLTVTARLLSCCTACIPPIADCPWLDNQVSPALSFCAIRGT